MLNVPTFVQFSLGSMNVDSQIYVSSSLTWTAFKCSLVNGPSESCSTVTLKPYIFVIYVFTYKDYHI